MTRQLASSLDDLVAHSVNGLQTAHPGLVSVYTDPPFVVRANRVEAKTAIVSGGGSGHEPLHTGFVGAGMLDAAVPGPVFTSPSAAQILAAIRAVDAGSGVLLIVKNYTGDVLNFSIAAELAADYGIATETVLVDDDLATDIEATDVESGSDEHRPGRRGTAAVVVVEKICGAAAEAGQPLTEVAALGRRVAAGSRSMAAAFTACTHPGGEAPAFAIADDEVEFGVGIHGERGTGTRPRGTAAELIAALTEPIIAALNLGHGDQVIAIVNGLGGTPALELALAQHELTRCLAARDVSVARALTGSFVTSLDMRGVSITLVRAEAQLLRLWDAPVRTPALTW